MGVVKKIPALARHIYPPLPHRSALTTWLRACNDNKAALCTLKYTKQFSLSLILHHID